MAKPNPMEELLNKKLGALYSKLTGRSPSGRPAANCMRGCGRFATVETCTKHPVAGDRVYLLCDRCDPPTLEFDSIRTVESKDFVSTHWSDKDNAWARSVNETLEGICF